jgi:RND family efflux transporter MFP subunit
VRTIVWIGLALLLVACGKPEPAAQAVSPAPTFSTQPLAEVAVRRERCVPAAVVGKHEARLSAEVAAKILALPVDVGQTVKKGALVVRLDPRDAELALERAEAALAQVRARHAQAQAQAQRARTLREQNFYSAEALTLKETELTAAAADLRAATAQRDTARHALDKHSLRAPFDGVVRARTGQLGELAAPGTALLTLVSADDLELAAQLQPEDAAAFSSLAATSAAAVSPLVPAVGSMVAPTFVANGAIYPLTLLRVSPALNRESRSLEARFAFRDTAPAAGLEGQLLWDEPGQWLPADLLVRRDGRYGVFIARNGKATFQVLPAAQEGRPVRVDLPPQTAIVIRGRHALQDGQALK